VAPWLVRLEPDKKNGLVKASAADVFQVRSIAQERIVRQMGALSDKVMKEITRA
jgi:mRNA interferase MazF